MMRIQNGNLTFSIFGYPVTVQWMFWIVAALLGGATRAQTPDSVKLVLIWVVVVFVSILWHELGHAFFQRRYGGRPTILLYGMGGLAQSSGSFSRRQAIIISSAGPAASLLLGLVTLAVILGLGWPARLLFLSFPGNPPPNGLVIGFYQSMLWANIFWAFINLLPVLPLDGGRILEAAASGHVPYRTVAFTGAITAGLVAVAALTFGQLFIALLFGFLAYKNYQRATGVHRGFW
jgi:stage IV sporulation protein FB